MKKVWISLLVFAVLIGCQQKEQPANESIEPLSLQRLRSLPFTWRNATVYFMLTDRFLNADPNNDFSFERKQDGAVLRDFKGGDLKGITQKIKERIF